MFRHMNLLQNNENPSKWYNLCDKLTYYTFSRVIHSSFYRNVLQSCLLVIYSHNIKVFCKFKNFYSYSLC